MEDRRSHAKDEHRDEYSKKLKGAIMELEIAGQSLGALTCAKKMAVEEKNFEEAKVKAAEIEELRNEIYRAHNVADLLELKGQVAKNDEKVTELPPASRHKQKPRSRSPSPGPNPPPRRTDLPPPRCVR